MRAVFDVETDNLLEGATKVHALVIKDADTGEEWSCHDQPVQTGPHIREGLHILSTADVLIGHNCLTFDIPVLKKLYPEFSPRGEVRDTLVCSRVLWADIYAQLDTIQSRSGPVKTRIPDFPSECIGKHSLKAWGYRLGCLKGLFNEQTDWKAWSPEMQEYCRRDVEITVKLFKKIEAEKFCESALVLEHRFADLVFLQEQFGFRFNRAKAQALYEGLVKTRLEIEQELQQVFPPRVETLKTPAYYVGDGVRYGTKGAAQKAKAKTIEPGPLRTKLHPFNPGSGKQIADRLKERGWIPTKFTDKGTPCMDETVVETLPYPEAKPLTTYLIVKKRLGQIAEGDKAWLKLEAKGRMHGRVSPCGTVSTRAAHYDPNLSQVPAINKDKKGNVLFGEEGRWGYECRDCFYVDDGYVLLGADASGIQLRILGHYLAAYDGGEYARQVVEGDIHSYNRDALGLQATKDSRAIAKQFIYAYVLGCGDEKAGKILTLDDSEIPEFKRHRDRWGRAVHRLTRAKRPFDDRIVATVVKGGLKKSLFEKKIPALAKLRERMGQVIDARGHLLGIDGRKLYVRSKHSALSQLLQSAEKIIVSHALVTHHQQLKDKGLVWGKDFANVVFNHDEAQIQIRPDVAEEAGKMLVQCIRDAGKFYKVRCPMDGEFKIGMSWAETH